ncbi:MAG: hypothetical protein ACFFAO_10595 [Candidatus Hermodarchaeota archaeon]
MIDIFYTLLLNARPLIILIIPLFFLWKHYYGKFYFRIVVGIIIFYLIYWILPMLFQLGESPNKLVAEEGRQENIAIGIRYIIAHIGSLIALFAFYPLVALPFIFFVAPFFSLLYLCNYLRKEDGTVRENLAKITYEFEESPFEKMKKDIIRSDWSREKEILKLMIVLLPISLYLLQTILDISGLQNISLTTGETALGWFIEILMVYLAIFILSIELLFSSQIALKGRYFGEQLRNQIYRSLYSVGAPISILSLILFVIQYSTSLLIIIYFMAYFIMVSIIFVLFLKIFEPISILLFVKLIEYWKKREKKPEKVKNTVWYDNWYYTILAGISAIGIILILNILVFNPLFSLFGETQRTIINSARYSYRNPSLRSSLRFDLLNIFNVVVLVIIPIFIAAFLFAFSLRYTKNMLLSILMFFSITIPFSILMIAIGANPLISFAPEEYWLTGQMSYTEAFGFVFYTFRTAAFDANLFPGGQITLLGGLAIPYLFSRYVITIIFWSFTLFYFHKKFKIKNVEIDEKRVDRVLFSTIDLIMNYQEFSGDLGSYLITRNDEIIEKRIIESENDQVKSLLSQIEDDVLLKDILPSDETEKKQLYKTIRYLFSHNFITIWVREFSYIFEKIEKQSLYVIYNDGRDIFNYPFVKEVIQDPALVSGMFTAITSFVKETTKSTQLLKTIDHGDITILIEYGINIFGALFIKGNPSTEIRTQLTTYINTFEHKHKSVLLDWNGILTPFRDSNQLVEEIFKEI